MVRLHQSAKNYKMSIPFSVEELCNGTLDLIRSNSLNNCYLRPVAYYGYDTLGSSPKNCPVEVAIGTLDWGAYVGKALKKEQR